jgi:hypothetical protein
MKVVSSEKVKGNVDLESKKRFMPFPSSGIMKEYVTIVRHTRIKELVEKKSLKIEYELLSYNIDPPPSLGNFHSFQGTPEQELT